MTGYIVVLPLHGLHLAEPSRKLDSLFHSPYTLVGRPHFDALDAIPQESTSLQGNLRMIRARLDPDALLMLHSSSEFSMLDLAPAYETAEEIAAAHCVCALLMSAGTEGSGEGEPMPLFRARFRELCDLPIAFSAQRVVVVGHANPIGWATVGVGGMGPRLTTGLLEERLRRAPPTLTRMLSGQRPACELDDALARSAKALFAAFQSTSPGQFVGSAVAAGEILVGGDDERWAEKELRLTRLCGDAYGTRVAEVIRARHEFVHRAAQPSLSSWHVPRSALALVVQAWGVVAELAESGRAQSLEELAYLLRGSRQPKLSEGPVGHEAWIHKYLISADPSTYRRRFVCNGFLNCPTCGGSATVDPGLERRATHSFRCNSCGLEFRAQVR